MCYVRSMCAKRTRREPTRLRTARQVQHPRAGAAGTASSIAPLLILNRSAQRDLVTLPACVSAVEQAFRTFGERRTLGLGRVHLQALEGGAFHLVLGGLYADAEHGAVAVKLNGRFPPREPGGGQRLAGAVLVADATTGKPLALLDSMLITSLRTAAVTALVVRLLARAGAETALLVGGGRQSRGQIDALALALNPKRLLVFDSVEQAAADAAAYARESGIACEPVADLRAASRSADVIVTVTPSRSPILGPSDVSPGSLVVALGADAPGKQELAPELLARARVVVDVLEQAADSGELQHALAAGSMTTGDVHGELGEVVAGLKPGREDEEQIFVFDGTGTALQDLAAAELMLDEALRRDVGVRVDLEG